MKKLLLIVMMLLQVMVFGQEKWSTKSGMIEFEASVASFEEVKAKNEQVGAILKTSDGSIACLALMNGFRFKIALMQEHFNENYLESEKYPKAILKGKIQDLDIDKLSEVPLEHQLVGELSMHGKTKAVDIPVNLTRNAEGILLYGAFELQPADFNIEIPSVVANKIAESVDVRVSLNLKGS